MTTEQKTPLSVLEEMADQKGYFIAGVVPWTWRRWSLGHPISRLARPVATRAIKRLRALAIKRGVPASEVPDLVVKDGRVGVRCGHKTNNKK
jgi:hypothetical protein